MTDACENLPLLANDYWLRLLTPIERLRLSSHPRAHWIREKLIIDPEERPHIHRAPSGRWIVDYHRSVSHSGVADVMAFDSWAEAMLDAIYDVRDRLCDWVAVNDGLHD
jgi:hypothetical protein